MDDLKQLARQIFRQTLVAIDIPGIMSQRLAPDGSRIFAGGEEVDLAAYDRVVAIAVGKAAVATARGLVDVLPAGVELEGILAAPHDALAEVPGFISIGASHPLPDEGSLLAAREVLALVRRANRAHTLIFFLLSGGGSALMELPLDPGVRLDDLRDLYRLLVGCGGTIDEINAVRKHLSAVKGGRLAEAAPAAMKLTLGFTDVPVGCESALGSGPTLPDPTTSAGARAVIERYRLLEKLPRTIQAKFAPGGDLPETPKAGDPAFARSIFQLVLGMDDLFHHAHQAAQCHGCITICDNSTDDWPLEKAADYLLGELERLAEANPGHRVTLIADGEVSSPVTGEGVGGRNSAFVLNCVGKIAGKNIAVLSAGTDGKDGSSPAAGAVADGHTIERARALSLDPSDFARRCDSYNFFRVLGDAIMTGPTGNNLRDLRVLIAG